MTLVITDGEFWWSWRELNPRPKFLHTILMQEETMIYLIKQHISCISFLSILRLFKMLPPNRRHFLHA